jgi:hypothetical protein
MLAGGEKDEGMPDQTQIMSFWSSLSGHRTSGMLLHITSLPSQYGIGDMGPAALTWVDQPDMATLRTRLSRLSLVTDC